MIISASYKTDIPTFYGEWFMRRLRAGYCKVINPYNRLAFRVALDRNSVDGIVFWTKNAGPFLKHLPEVRARGYPFVVQYTINGYPRALETSVVDARRSVEHAQSISAQFGPKVVVWRYDTIITSSLTPVDFHLSNFERLARELAGTSDEVVISFANVYRKTKRNLDAAATEHGFTWSDPTISEKKDMATKLAHIATEHGFRLTICSQRDYLVPAAGDARCIDADRLAAVGGRRFRSRPKGNREECGCFESRDIGDYDTCPHGCVYCYAVEEHERALARFRMHDPDSEFLVEWGKEVAERQQKQHPNTLTLFPRED